VHHHLPYSPGLVLLVLVDLKEWLASQVSEKQWRSKSLSHQ
jgi:hypothetical protein